jgi:hypothetical protein
VGDYSQMEFPTAQGFELSRESRAQADLKFTYVVSCQIYGQQKQRKAQQAADIALLLQRYNYYFYYHSSIELPFLVVLSVYTFVSLESKFV